MNMNSKQMNLSEEDLVKGIKQQDCVVFSILYNNYAEALMGAIARYFTDESLRYDILHDVMEKIWRSGGKYDASKGTLFTWMLRLTRNYCIDVLRSKEYKKSQKEQNIEECDYEYLRVIDYNIDIIDLKTLISKLRPEEQVVLDKVYFKGYTHAEASEELNIPLGTVKTRIATGIKELRKYFRFYNNSNANSFNSSVRSGCTLTL